MWEILFHSRFFPLFSVFLSCNILHSNAQSVGANPFDIGHIVILTNDSLFENSIKDTLQLSNNPFDIVRETNYLPNAKIIADKSSTISPIQKTNPSARPQGFLFSLVLGILLLLTILVSISRSLINKIYQAFFNDVVLKMLFRSRSSLSISIYLALYAMFMVNLGVFIYLILRYNGWLINQSDIQTLSVCVISVMTLVIAKHITLASLSYTFPITKEIDLYSFIIMIFGILMGLLLAPANVFFAYADAPTAKIIIIGMAIALGIIYALKAIRSLFLVQNVIFSDFFHFLLYLCAIEIVPILLILKFINTKLQIPILSTVM
jgi:hypothetical protein